MRIISLTSIPPRFDALGPTLRSLIQQNARADKIILYIPRSYRRFPDYDGHLPSVPEGVEIRVADHDYGPASKVLHAVREFRGQDVGILFCDDDRVYPPGWSKVFFDARAQLPDAAIAPISFAANEPFSSDQLNRPDPQAQRANRALDIPYQFKLRLWKLGRLFGRRVEGPSHAHIKTAGYRDIFQGYGGVMIRPDFFDDDVFDIPDVLWAVDDIWLSGMLAKAGTPLWAPSGVKGPRLQPAHDSAPLYMAVLDGADRATADRRCFEYMRKTYGIWP